MTELTTLRSVRISKTNQIAIAGGRRPASAFDGQIVMIAQETIFGSL